MRTSFLLPPLFCFLTTVLLLAVIFPLTAGAQNMSVKITSPQPHTKMEIDKDGYMHTGDVAVMDEEGYLKIVDRTKDMIIVGGYKVFSSKIEDIISKHPAIDAMALIGVPNTDRPGSEIVKAIIQIDAEYSYDGDEGALKENITSFAKDNCAPYEVPKIIEFMDELPLTLVGKIDKKLLRK